MRNEDEKEIGMNGSLSKGLSSTVARLTALLNDIPAEYRDNATINFYFEKEMNKYDITYIRPKTPIELFQEINLLNIPYNQQEEMLEQLLEDVKNRSSDPCSCSTKNIDLCVANSPQVKRGEFM